GFEMEPAEDGPPPSRGNMALYNIAAIDSESPTDLKALRASCTMSRRAVALFVSLCEIFSLRLCAFA
ncbi:MAG: hypothetical protein WBA75_11560, partial [Sphingopyxis granuli]